VLGVINRSRKVVRHGMKFRSLFRRGERLVLRPVKVVRHSFMRARFAWKGVRYRSRWTGWGISAWKVSELVKAPRATHQRHRLAHEYASHVTCAQMSPQQGFHLFAPDHFPGIDEVITTCRRLYESKVLRAGDGNASNAATGVMGGRRMKGDFLRNLLTNEDLRRNPVLVDFALSDAAMGMVTKYLGSIPHLNRVDLLYSVSRAGDDNVSSQLFHVDPEGLTQVKFFINVFDVGDEEGPFTFIPADETARVIRDVSVFRRQRGKPHAGRYLDDEIAAVGASGAIVRVKGPQGSGVAVDTSRCLHLGSRVSPGSFRLCLYIQYCTTRELGNAFDVQRYSNDPVRYWAVQHSTASAGTEVAAPHQTGPGLS
jgi:hypothetical protein